MDKYTLKQLLDSKFPQPDPIIEGWLWKKSKHVVGGREGDGKSLFVQAMGLAASKGGTFLGTWTIPLPMTVVYLQSEGLVEETSQRFAKMKQSHPHDMDRFHIIYSDSFFLDVPEVFKELLDHLDTIKPELVIVDPMYLMINEGNLNEGDVMRKLIHKLDLILARYQCGILLVHHENKDIFSSKEGKKIHRPRGDSLEGHSNLRRWIQVGWILKADHNNEAIKHINRFKTRTKDTVKKITITIDPNTLAMTVLPENKD